MLSGTFPSFDRWKAGTQAYGFIGNGNGDGRFATCDFVMSCHVGVWDKRRYVRLIMSILHVHVRLSEKRPHIYNELWDGFFGTVSMAKV